MHGDVHRRPAAQIIAQQRRIGGHPVRPVVFRGLHPVVQQRRHQAVVGQGDNVQLHETAPEGVVLGAFVIVEGLIVAALHDQRLEVDRFPVQAQAATEAVKRAVFPAVVLAGRPHHGAGGEIGGLAAEIAKYPQPLPGALAFALAEGLLQRDIDILAGVVVRRAAAAVYDTQAVLQPGLETAAGLDADLVDGKGVRIAPGGEVVDFVGLPDKIGALGTDQMVSRLETADAQAELFTGQVAEHHAGRLEACGLGRVGPVVRTGEIGRGFVDARRVDEQERDILVQDAGGQHIQAVNAETGGRAQLALVKAVAGHGAQRQRDRGFEDHLFPAALAGDLVAVVAEALAEVVQLGKGDMAHVAVEAVLAGEGRYGRQRLAEGQGDYHPDQQDEYCFFHGLLLTSAGPLAGPAARRPLRG